MKETISEETINIDQLSTISQKLFSAFGLNFNVEMIIDTLSVKLINRNPTENTVTQYQMKDDIEVVLNNLGYSGQIAACIPPNNKGYIEWVQIYDIQEI